MHFGTALLALVLVGNLAAHADSLDGVTPVSLSFQKNELPASDLIYQSKILSAQQAWDLERNSNVDLSKLNPDPTSDIWPGTPTTADSKLDHALPIQSGDTVKYLDAIGSSEGRYRFNVQVDDPNAPTLTVVLSTELHTLLLRRELLRRLGYRVPPIKYLPQLKVRFSDALTRDDVIENEIPKATNAAASRWAIAVQGQDPNTLTLQDVMVMEATPKYYNLALGAPVDVIPSSNQYRPESERILRALAVIYGLASVPESLNQLDWNVGRVSAGKYIFTVDDIANFSCTLDDTLWVLRKIAALSRDDIAASVAEAEFPNGAAELLVEKLISRRDSLLGAFQAGLGKIAPITFDGKISDPDPKGVLQRGKLTRDNWSGYASRFAYGDAQTPLQDLKYYLLAEAENNLLGNLVDEANSLLPGATIQSQIQRHENNIQKGLAQYLTSGTDQKIPLQTWFAPLANGRANISRDVVIGDYLGTNNLIQLADTFGAQIQVGLYIGLDGLPAYASVSGTLSASVSIELTHLTPLSSLKQAVQTPLKNEFVPWIFRHAAGIFKAVNQSKPGAPVNGVTPINPDDLKKKLAAEMDGLKGFLGIGDSLILTESISGNEGVSASVGSPIPIAPQATLSPSANQLVISRLHIYRKDVDTIYVFQDKGELNDFDLTFAITLGLPAQFPLFSTSGDKILGNARTEIYQLNVDSDPKNNPALYSNAIALSSLLGSGSTELLKSLQKPIGLDVKYQDGSSSFQLLHLVRRSLNQNGTVEIDLPGQPAENYLSLMDGNQAGNNFQQLATQAATYVVQRLSDSGTFSVNSNPATNPGQSFLGASHTRQAQFQAKTSASGIQNSSVQIQYRWEGWNYSAADTVKLATQLSSQYGFTLFNPGFLGTTDSIQLYNFNINIGLYEDALLKISSIAAADEKNLYGKYSDIHHCNPFRTVKETRTKWAVDSGACSALHKFDQAYHQYSRKGLSVKVTAQALFDLAEGLERFADWSDVLALVGPDHMFIYANITGFRNGSESSDPIFSNTFGKPDPHYSSGVLSTAQQMLGIQDGEFNAQWLRSHL